MSAVNAILGAAGWAILAFGMSARAAAATVDAPVAAILGVTPAWGFVVGTICPILGTACLIANAFINYRNSDASRRNLREQARAEGHAAGKAEALRSFGLAPDGKAFPPRDAHA